MADQVEPDERAYLKLFRMPRPVKITGRSSSITNSFINSIIPVIPPSESEVREALSILGTLDDVSCSYCGDTFTEWDHLRPLVVDKRPTGYISEIQNLVPACGKCNQSKGNKPWRGWITSAAVLSPTTRGVPGLDLRVHRLQSYEAWRPPTRLDFADIVGSAAWAKHEENRLRIIELMVGAQRHADVIRASVAEAYRKQGGSVG